MPPPPWGRGLNQARVVGYEDSHLFTFFSCAATSQKHVPVRRRLRDQRGHRRRLLLHLQALRTQRNRHGVRSEGERAQQLNICFCVFNARRATAGFWKGADDVLKSSERWFLSQMCRYLSILHISMTMWTWSSCFSFVPFAVSDAHSLLCRYCWHLRSKLVWNSLKCPVIIQTLLVWKTTVNYEDVTDLSSKLKVGFRFCCAAGLETFQDIQILLLLVIICIFVKNVNKLT